MKPPTCASGERLMFSVSKQSPSLRLMLLMLACTGSAAAFEPLSASSLSGLDTVASQYAQQGGLEELDDGGLETVHGQAGSLILVDRIGPNEVVVPPAHGNAKFNL